MKVRTGNETREMKAVWMEEGVIRCIDQRLLPGELRVVEALELEEVARFISDMVVRGAPTIGATASYGVAQAALAGLDLKVAAERLKATRPTAQDLFHAIDRTVAQIEAGGEPAQVAAAYALDIEDRCRRIGEHGSGLLEDGARVLTHCNAGALATVDWGTALAPMRVAHSQGKKLFVYVDETRPRLQGARLTAWELWNEGIEHAVIADNAAGHYMARGEVDIVIVGADRVLANGDFANKIGTYEKAVVAHENGIPFYVAAPESTFDPSLSSGGEIPIEERDQGEVHEFRGTRATPAGSRALNPAFDVTPARYVTGYMTENGVSKEISF